MNMIIVRAVAAQRLANLLAQCPGPSGRGCGPECSTYVRCAQARVEAKRVYNRAGGSPSLAHKKIREVAGWAMAHRLQVHTSQKDVAWTLPFKTARMWLEVQLDHGNLREGLRLAGGAGRADRAS